MELDKTKLQEILYDYPNCTSSNLYKIIYSIIDEENKINNNACILRIKNCHIYYYHINYLTHYMHDYDYDKDIYGALRQLFEKIN